MNEQPAPNQPQSQIPPFHCTYSPNIPGLLDELNVSLLVSTYQAGKVIVLSPSQGGLVQLPRTFQKPMGIAVADNKIAVATRHEVMVLVNDPKLARIYPGGRGKYDGLFAPRATFFANEVDIHDIAWAGDTLWAVNTLFSCLCTIDFHFSFVPQWHPAFISRLAPEDRCHLNGMALLDGKPEWVTALGTSDTPMGWRENRLNGGVLVHVPSGEVVLSNLSMPHSPRVHAGKIYLLISLTGELVLADPRRGSYEVVAKVPGYVRGLAFYGEYAFIGMSKIRPGRVLGDLSLDSDKLLPGVGVVHLPTGRVVGLIQYQTSCEEIYDVQIIPGLLRPGIVGLSSGEYMNVLSTPKESFWAVPPEERQ